MPRAKRLTASKRKRTAGSRPAMTKQLKRVRPKKKFKTSIPMKKFKTSMPARKKLPRRAKKTSSRKRIGSTKRAIKRIGSRTRKVVGRSLRSAAKRIRDRRKKR